MAQDRKPGFNDICETCGKDVHTCTHCRFYRSGARWDCTESSVQEPVTDKTRRNYCEWFQTRPELFVKTDKKPAGVTPSEKARADLKKLFGD